MTTIEQFQIEAERLEGFCRKWGINKMALFGSVLGDDFGPESDVDILIDLVPEARLGLLDMVRLEWELSAILGRKVDVQTRHGVENSPNPIRRQSILGSARTVYVA